MERVSDEQWGAMIEDAIAQVGVLARELGMGPGHGAVTIQFNRTQEFVDVLPSAQYRRRPKPQEKAVDVAGDRGAGTR